MITEGVWPLPQYSTGCPDAGTSGEFMDVEVMLRVDGTEHRLVVDTRTTLLDALRERLGITRPKQGCDHGQCGACTVLLDRRRAVSCLALAVPHPCAENVSAEGLGYREQ